MDRTLELRIKKLMLFRLVMVTTLLLIAAYVEAVSETLLAVNPLYFLIGATYFLTVFHALALRFLPSLVAQVFIQVVGDLLVITGIVYVTGGVRPGFMLLYPISVLSGSILLHRRGGIVLAGVATLLYAATLWAVRAGFVPAQGLADVPFLPAKQVLNSIFVTGVACGTVALIGSYLAESLRHAGEKLEEAAEQVADLRELNEVIVNSIHSGLLTTDAAGHILYVNSFGAAILNQPAPTVRGRTLRDVFASSLLEAGALQARAGSRSLARLEIEYARPGGPSTDLGISVTPLATRDRPGSGYLLVFQDLTEIKRLEEEVRIKEKLAAVGEMAAQLAHEIRNPLGSISGSAQVLMGGANVSEEHEQLLRIITRESRRLSDTLNRFLFQAKPTGRPRGPVDLRPLLSEAVTLLRNGPEVGPDHEVDFEAAAGPHVCLADPDQITQVFWNLARNGLEAMPSGGRLRVRLHRGADDLVFSVHDQGRGMGREEQRRMFEPFHSASPMGTGLGLAIVYRIVREHGGDITVRSTPDEGTQVEVRLPLVPVPVEVSTMQRILVVDDEPSMREMLSIMLKRDGFDVVTAESRAAAAALLAQGAVDLVITDVRLPDGDGIEILRHVKSASPETVVIVMTAFGTVEAGVAALKLGAQDYLQKPFDVDELKIVVRNSLERQELREENLRLKREFGRPHGLEQLIGVSPAMGALFEMIRSIAPTASTVLVTGESGTGKELVARAIHSLSPRRDGPFVSVNCGALPDNLLESELFGHMKGAFTDAHQNKKGLFEAAHRGTLFLDEVGETSAPMQVKLLRALQERKIRRVGGTEEIEVDVRVISATNVPLEALIKEKRFREDLFYRLQVIPVHTPPLRERREDVPRLAEHFLRRFTKEMGKNVAKVSEEAMAHLRRYSWPGNVRELENVMERAIALETTEAVLPERLPETVRVAGGHRLLGAIDGGESLPLDGGFSLDDHLRAIESRLLAEALERSGGDRGAAARLLGVSPRSLRYLIQKHAVAADKN